MAIRTMDNTQTLGHPLVGLSYTLCSVILGIFASILNNVELWIRIGAGLIAMVSGMMAIRYYYYATKEKIKQVK